MPDTLTLSLLLAGAAAGGFVNGLAGFGTALFALGFWLLVLPPIEAVALAASLSVLSGLQGVWVVRHGIAYRRLARFVVPAVLGLPLGVALLQHLDAGPLRRLIAVLLLGYGVWFSIRALPRWRGVPRWADSGVGFLGGLLGGMAGLSGALPMLWCSLRGWSKSETRGVLQPFNVVVLILAVAYYGVLGHLDTAFLVKLAISLPATLVAAQLGIGLFNRLSDAQYRRLLVSLMVLSGLGLLLREGVG